MNETITQTKICNKCKQSLPFNLFGNRKSNKDGKRSQCKECEKEYAIKNKERIREYRKRYKEENKEMLSNRNREYHIKNKDRIQKYYEDNKEMFSEKGKEYREKNKEAISKRRRLQSIKYRERNAKYKKQYQIENADKLKEVKRKYYEKNKEKIKIHNDKYRQTEKGKAVRKNSHQKRRAKKKSGNVTTDYILKLEHNAKVCYWCSTSLKDKEVHIDHYFPLSKNGEHNEDNLVVSCATCNMKKSSKDPIKFANSIGKLL